jgi:hypothetical protein
MWPQTSEGAAEGRIECPNQEEDKNMNTVEEIYAIKINKTNPANRTDTATNNNKSGEQVKMAQVIPPATEILYHP